MTLVPNKCMILNPIVGSTSILGTMNGSLCSCLAGTHNSYIPSGLSTALSCFQSNVATGGSLIQIGIYELVLTPINPISLPSISEGAAADE